MKNTDNNNKVLPIDTKAMDEILETLYNVFLSNILTLKHSH